MELRCKNHILAGSEFYRFMYSRIINEIMENSLVNYLKTFKSIPDSEQTLLSEAFERRAYREGEILFESGNICRELYFICEGILIIFEHKEKGNEVAHFFLKENHFCTLLSSFINREPALNSIKAACDVVVLAIHKDKLMALYDKLPDLKELIDGILRQSLLDKIQIKNDYQGLDSTARYTMFLSRQPEVARRVQLGYIASYLGITPQSLSRIRKNMSRSPSL